MRVDINIGSAKSPSLVSRDVRPAEEHLDPLMRFAKPSDWHTVNPLDNIHRHGWTRFRHLGVMGVGALAPTWLREMVRNPYKALENEVSRGLWANNQRCVLDWSLRQRRL
jgi:hypothetical protein